MLTLDEARKIIRRAVEKSTEVRWITAYAVVDAAGNVISLSRMDGAPAAAAATSLSKAFIAAVTGRTTLAFADEVEASGVRLHGWHSVLGQPLFPGPGGAPIVKEGAVVGGFSQSLSSAPVGMKIRVDNVPMSRADIVTSYALETPYEEQHADQP